MRKSIEVSEGKVGKTCTRLEKMLKELNTLANTKIKLLRSDDQMGDGDVSKLGKLDDISLKIDDLIGLISDL